MLTSLGQLGIAKHYPDAAISAFLSKPVKISDLFKILGKLSSSQSSKARAPRRDERPSNPANGLRIWSPTITR